MRKRSVSLIIILVSVGMLVSPATAALVTLVGEVNDNEQFVVDGETYEIDNNAVGDDLVLNHAGEKVKIVGILRETRQGKIIKVNSFEIIEE